MKAIVLVDQNWGIGKDGKQNIFIKEDLERFKNLTLNTRIIVGRKTLATFPKGQPLPYRNNVILTRDASFAMDGATVFNTISELLRCAPETDDEETFVVGGAEIYEQLLPYCDTVYVTKVFSSFDSDRFFTNLDQSMDWRVGYKEGLRVSGDITYAYLVYTRSTPNNLNATIRPIYDWILMNTNLLMYGNEDQVGYYIAELGSQCIEYAMKSNPPEPSSEPGYYQGMPNYVSIAHSYWNDICDFIKYKYSFDLDRDGMLMMFKEMLVMNTDDNHFSQIFNTLLDEHVKKHDDTPKKTASLFTTPPPVDLNYENSDLFREYFSLIQKLGVFRNDISAYETEEQIKMHNRIMEIYTILGSNSPI